MGFMVGPEAIPLYLPFPVYFPRSFCCFHGMLFSYFDQAMLCLQHDFYPGSQKTHSFPSLTSGEAGGPVAGRWGIIGGAISQTISLGWVWTVECVFIAYRQRGISIPGKAYVGRCGVLCAVSLPS